VSVPVPLPPWFRDRAAKLLAEPEFVHTDSCGWMGDSAEHPCTCRVPDLLRVIAAWVGDVTRPALDLERACDYFGDVSPEQPEQLPDVTVLREAPDADAVKQWVVTWKPVRVHLRGAWQVGIVKDQAQLPDGAWALRIEHGTGGMHDAWHSATWIMHDERLVRPIEAEPPS
jgi:hypothetical protein